MIIHSLFDALALLAALAVFRWIPIAAPMAPARPWQSHRLYLPVASLLGDMTYGTPTLLPWGVDFGDGIPPHPVQLYESAVMASFLVWFLWAARRGDAIVLRAGFYLFIGVYAAPRFLWEFLKPYGSVIGPSTCSTNANRHDRPEHRSGAEALTLKPLLHYLNLPPSERPSKGLRDTVSMLL